MPYGEAGYCRQLPTDTTGPRTTHSRPHTTIDLRLPITWGESSFLLPVGLAIRTFSKKREWEQFHSPKNLAMALSVEVSEVIEHFQWLTQEESRNLPVDRLAEVREEI